MTKEAKSLLKPAIFFLVFTVITFFYFNDLPNHPLHVDEHEWVRRGGVLYELYFVDKDFLNSFWRSYYSYDQPSSVHYLFGAWTRSFYQKDLDSLFKETGFNQGWTMKDEIDELWSEDKWWIKYMNQEPQTAYVPDNYKSAYKVIVTNRYLSVAFALATLFSVFLIGKALVDYKTGLFAMILLSVNPLFYRVARQAISDAFLNFFLVGGLLFFLFLQKKAKKVTVPKYFVLTALFAIFLGLSFSVKLNGFILLLLALLALFATYFYDLLSNKGARENLSTAIFQSFFWVLGTFLVFILLNPFTWSSPVRNTYLMFGYRLDMTKCFHSTHPDDALHTLPERLITILDKTTSPRGEFTSLSSFLPWLDTLLIVAGFAGLLVLFKTKKGKMFKRRLIIFAVWLFGVFLFLNIYLLIDWDRHFLPLIAFIVLLEAIGATTIVNTVAKKLNLKKTSS